MKIKKVLVVDDDRDLAHMVRDFLEDKGYTVVVAYDGKEGLELCRKEKPDLITLDLFMPKIDGIRFLDLLQREPELSMIPVIMVSVVSGEKGKDEKPVHLGVVDWLKKPFDFDDLWKTIKNSENLLPDLMKEGKKIAIIEDDESVSETVAALLQSKSYNAVVYTTSDNIVEKIARERPFLILLDILMPGTDGLGVIRQLKNNPGTSNIPIVVVSALDIYDHRRKYLMAGATEYYVGSFSSQTFLNELQNNITKHEMVETQRHSKILIADDDVDLANMAIDNLRAEKLETIYAKDGEEALQRTYQEMPDLILLDIQMPKKDGYQVFKEIRSDILLQNIPIILFTAKSTVRDRVFGLELGADDYITKPYDMEELIARVKMVLRRTTSNREVNPLTRLPGNIAIERMINDYIRTNKDFAVLYVDINDFKPYNDFYGFYRGDAVIRSMARILLESLQELDFRDDFVGHIGGDDFIVVTRIERIDAVCTRIIEKFDKIRTSFYDAQHVEKGFITVKDRKGNILDFPFLSVAIGVVSTKYRRFNSLGEVAKTGTEMKAFAKKFKNQGSHYNIDERKN